MKIINAILNVFISITALLIIVFIGMDISAKTSTTIANIDSTVNFQFKTSIGGEPYVLVDGCSIEKNGENFYAITSRQAGRIIVYKDFGLITLNKIFKFENPQIKLTKNTVNIGDEIAIEITGVSTPVEVSFENSIGSLKKSRKKNHYNFIPKTEGSAEFSFMINDEVKTVLITVDNPEMDIGTVKQKEETPIYVSGITTDYTITTDNENIAVIVNNDVIKGVATGKVNVILTANGQEFKKTIDVKEHVHDWSDFTTVAPTCVEVGYDVRTCFCGEEERTNEVKMVAHEYSDWTVTKDTTALTIDGELQRTCANCDTVESKIYTYTEKVANDIANRNAYGRLSIPDVGVDVALIAHTGEDYDLRQSIVDDDDSAAIFEFDGCTLIADHNFQGFSAIEGCETEMNAYIVTENGTQKLRCIYSGFGQNCTLSIRTEKGDKFTELCPNSIIMYTCHNGWRNIAVTVWRYV